MVPLGYGAMKLNLNQNIKKTILTAIVTVSLSFGIYLLYLLSTQITTTSDVFNELPVLLGVGVALIVVLMILVGAQLLVTVRRYRAGVFGSKLTVRLILVFVLVSLVPGVVMYGISVQFLAGSIESWFDIRVDSALEGGLNLGRANLENGLGELQSKADSMAVSLSYQSTATQVASIDSLRDQAAISEATLFTTKGEVVASSNSGTDSFIPLAPTQSMLRQAQLQESYAGIEEDEDFGLLLRVIVPINHLETEMQILQVTQLVPQRLARDAAMVQEAYRDYQELSLSRYGLQRLYTLALTLSLGLALFSVVLLAVMFSNRLSAPLGFLAAGTRAVAKGDFSQRTPINRGDELGFLTESFSVMTGQLSEAKDAAEKHEKALTQANAYLSSILETLSAGVLTFDERLNLRAYNPSAEEILGQTLENALPSGDSSTTGLDSMRRLIKDGLSESQEIQSERQVEIVVNESKKVLLVRISTLGGGELPGFIVVFDDVTNLLQAQRSALWGEVAQRLAHEIKNPLTPIQLSAERLTHRLGPKLDHDDAAMLSRSIKTIVDQVAALKGMVNAFNEYSRNPDRKSELVDVNELVLDVIELYRATSVAIETKLENKNIFLWGDTGKLRQVLHNLIQNSEQALMGHTNPEILIETVATPDATQIRIQDNGPGLSDEVMSRAFDPYYTTKAKGTGLGLAIVRKIIEEHDGAVSIRNGEVGAVIEITLPLSHTIDNAKTLNETI
ncbi:MAG TPA: PAS domain-containing sensor histidine kinase [Betaproteobacteria bacterium]|jgi:PAS domain S-box-containing protein|nr:PAS domain-containing sensor histidine kinase [Betaproteobacteria bacterium]